MTPSAELERRTDEVGALTRLTFDELGRAAGGIGAIHQAIADRAFGASGPAASPARVTHDAISKGVYTALGTGARLAGKGAAAALAQTETGRARLSATPRGAGVIAAVSGLIGDVLETEDSPLHCPMAVRVGGEIVTPRRAALAAAFPAAKPRIVVFLHGLMESEFGWGLGGRESYGARLERELGCTAVFVRYNTGRRISHNGAALDDLLGALFDEWPVELDEIALVGHSMGGLVARSACFRAAEGGAAWPELVRHVVSLGSPHLGAPLEQGVHHLSARLARLPETAPLSAFLRRRSGGIRDLRQGSLVDADWADLDPDDLRTVACAEVPLLEGATHCFVTATITRDPKHPIGRLIGDALVLQGSGSGRSRSRRIGFDEEFGHHVGGAGHIALLNLPVVADKLVEWLSLTPRR